MSSTIRPLDERDEIDELRVHCLAVIAGLEGDPKGHGIVMAKSKLGELVHWLRFHKAATARNEASR
jgi:hypothetical protein